MNLPKPKGLTPSQKRNLAALVLGGLLTLNEHWPQVVAVVGLHYHGLPIPPGITLALQLAAFGVTSLSRALNRAKSGTGTGIVGEAAPVPPAILAAGSGATSPVAPAPAVSAPAAPPSALPVADLLTLAEGLLAGLRTAPPEPAPPAPPTFDEALKIVQDAHNADINKSQTLTRTTSTGDAGVTAVLTTAPPRADLDPNRPDLAAAVQSQGGAVIVAPAAPSAVVLTGENQ